MEEKTSFYQKHKDLIWEIFRFLLVGGLSTIVDWIICFFVEKTLPPIMVNDWSVSKTIATSIGFSIGMIVNYVLSIIFVYKNKKDESSGKSFKDFLMFALISVVVLLLSTIGVFLLSDILKLEYIIARAIMTLIGLVINYIGRKLLIFK